MTKLRCLRNGQPWEIEAHDQGAGMAHDSNGEAFAAHFTRFVIDRRGDETLEVYSVVDMALVDMVPESQRPVFLLAEAAAVLEGAGITEVGA